MAFRRRLYQGLSDLKEWVKDYVDSKLDAALATKANKTHTHEATDITDLSTSKVPDYTRYFNITVNTTYTAAEDGFVMLLLGASNKHNGSVFLNIKQSGKTSFTQFQIGYDYLYKYNYGNDFCSAGLYPIRKGDRWYISKSDANLWRILRFYYAR